MKLLEKNELTNISGGDLAGTCAFMGGAALFSMATGNAAGAVGMGLAFILFCTSGDS